MESSTDRISSLEETFVGHHCQDVPTRGSLNDEMAVRMLPLGRLGVQTKVDPTANIQHSNFGEKRALWYLTILWVLCTPNLSF